MSDDSARPNGTVCPFCSVGCRLTHDGDRVRGRAGPANPDGRLCEKGLRAFDAVDDSDRLTTPLVRRDGDLVPVSWETALDRVVAEFEKVIDRHGPDTLAFLGAPRCSNEENYLLQKLARTLGTNNVDNRARLCHVETTRSLKSRLGRPASTVGLTDLHSADAFLVVGANPAVRQPVAFDGVIRPAVNDGATLIHVDPHRNETTRLADRHVAPRPGTDALVVSLCCALVLETGNVDREFVAGRTTGFEEFRELLAGYDVEERASTAGVDPADLRAVATALGEADRVAVLTGTGADDSATANALVDLLLLTGNVGRPGTGFHVLRGLTNEQGAVDAGCVPDRLPGHLPVTDWAARERLADEWDVTPPSTPGATEHELVDSFGDRIRAALVVGENPAISKTEPHGLARGLHALDPLVVQELYPSETTAHADVVLPAAAGVERAGTVTNTDRQVQRLHPEADPPGDALSDFAILRDLGRRLRGQAFAYDGPRDVFAELTRVAPPYGGLSYDELAERSRQWPATPVAGATVGDDTLYADSFETDDGRASFAAAAPSAETPDAEGLSLVVGDRAGGFTAANGATVDRRVTVHPDDAAAAGLEDGDPVVVTHDAAAVETTVRVRDSIRRGAVHLHASVADPLVRSDETTVRLLPVERRN